ncbi:MAG: hypothetical protein AABW80_05360 [Nanoarchaeota archaeon]
MTDKYDFKPAVKQPFVIPYTLQGDNAPRFVEDFNALVKRDYADNPNLKVLNLAEVNKVPTVRGSNSLVLPVVQSLVPERRVGLPEDIQRTLNDGDTIGIRGNHYVDLGVVLDFSGRHHEMAMDMFGQLPAQLRDVKKLPAVLVKYGLKNFDKGSYGLGLVYNPNTQVRHSPILAKPTGVFRNEDVSLETGLPSKLGQGTRTLWTASQGEANEDNLGLSRLCLSSSLDLYADNVGLAYSVEDGRVVLF